LRLRPGRPATLRLNAPGAAGWEDVSIGRFIARLPGGVQETIPVDAKRAGGLVTYNFPQGAALVMLCTGPKGDMRSDAWAHVTYCNKTLLTSGSSMLKRADEDPGAVLNRAGIPLEITPIFSPVGLTPGAELAVRAHVLGEKYSNAPVQSVRPDGSMEWQTTNASATATFKLPQAGKYTLRFMKTDADGDKIGEFVFEIRER
jgi:hypothetical protein